MKRQLLGVLFCLAISAYAEHPSLYVSNADKDKVREKIRNEPWASEAWKNLLAEIDPVVDRTLKDPQWAVSRLAMYWRAGERYTQCYLKDENWDRGEGNAPVPTVRLPGMRVWNDYANVPLEERIPFNESGDMLAKSRKDPSAPPKLVPYKESGHLVRTNNGEILMLAEKAAFAHWITGEEKYAKFAADIYWAWLLGTYHMQPPLDPGRSSGGPGGYAPGGILGYYDYEQIHDDLMLHAAPVHDFLHDYLVAHPHPHLADLRKDLDTVAGEVFKRFIDIGFVRGGKDGNWNVNGWNVMMRGILCLEPDSFYPDGKGREHYLRYYTTISTPYHNALPDILKQYDPVTGLWPESPGYALGTINTLLNLALPIRRAGTDTIEGNPMMAKAAFAVFPWMDARGNMVVFGDTRGGPASFSVFERLLTYYGWKNNPANATIASAAIRKGVEAGQYNRASAGWEGICLNAPLVPSGEKESLPAPRVAYSAEHRHIVMRNLNDEKNGLMFTLYGGTKGKHLSPNGLALQLYGKGWALSPDASGYESYWSKDLRYHQGVTGANTVLPGYAEGPITINAMDPSPAPDCFTSDNGVSPDISFADVSAGEKRRVIAMIRTSPTAGYYADIFRSRQADNDYLHHNLGDSLALMNSAGSAMPQNRDASLDPVPSGEYSFFSNIRKTATDDPFRAVWTIGGVAPPIRMALWMNGGKGREIFQVDAPHTNLNPAVSPAGTSIAPKITPTLIVRQNGTDGWDHPFVAVFEPYEGEKATVRSVVTTLPEDGLVSLEVTSKTEESDREIHDIILCATDPEKSHTCSGIAFKGDFAVVRKGGTVETDLYLGSGLSLSDGMVSIEGAEGRPVNARLYRSSDGWRYSSNGQVKITLSADQSFALPPARDAKVFIGN